MYDTTIVSGLMNSYGTREIPLTESTHKIHSQPKKQGNTVRVEAIRDHYLKLCLGLFLQLEHWQLPQQPTTVCVSGPSSPSLTSAMTLGYKPTPHHQQPTSRAQYGSLPFAPGCSLILGERDLTSLGTILKQRDRS